MIGEMTPLQTRVTGYASAFGIPAETFTAPLKTASNAAWSGFSVAKNAIRNSAASLKRSAARLGATPPSPTLPPALSLQNAKAAAFVAGAALYSTPALANDGDSRSISPLTFMALPFIVMGIMKRQPSLFSYMALPMFALSIANPDMAVIAWMWALLGWMWGSDKDPAAKD